MHFNIYLDDPTGLRLNQAANETGESRNALIRQAICTWLESRNRPAWPEVVQEFTGESDMPPFESNRAALTAPAEDPLA